MADVLQKVDRLIEGQGQLVELATKTAAELQEFKENIGAELQQVKATGEQTAAELRQVKATGEITASGLAKLTLVTADLRDEMRERFDRNEQTQQEILTLLREQRK